MTDEDVDRVVMEGLHVGLLLSEHTVSTIAREGMDAGRTMLREYAIAHARMIQASSALRGLGLDAELDRARRQVDVVRKAVVAIQAAQRPECN